MSPFTLLARVPYLHLTATLLVLHGSLAAQDDPSTTHAVPATTPSPQPRLQVCQLNATEHALGAIRFDLAKREIRFPATVNMNEGAIEFALVGTQGKTHESVLATDIRPVHLRTVMSLMNVEPSPSPSPAPETPGAEAQPVENQPEFASLVDIQVSWTTPADESTPETEPKRDAPAVSVSLRRCVIEMQFERISEFDEKVILQPLPEGPWEYTGSRFDDRGFEAERGWISLPYAPPQRPLQSSASEYGAR